ncbi:MAG: ribonuclease R [Bdellovibrionota bacterium]
MKRRFTSNKGSEGKSSSSKEERGGSGKKKKSIKNARSLADVLGGRSGGSSAGPTRSNYGGGNQRPERGGNFRDEKPSRPASPGPGPRPATDDASKAVASKKLTTIMTFQPPVEPVREEGNVRRGRDQTFEARGPKDRGSDSGQRESRAWKDEKQTRGGPATRDDREENRGNRRSGRSGEREETRDESRGNQRRGGRGGGRDEKPARGEERESGRREPGTREEPRRGPGPRPAHPPQKQARDEQQPARGTQKGTNKQGTNKQVPKQETRGSASGVENAWPKNRVKQIEVAPEQEERGGRGSSRRQGATRVTGIVKRHPDGFGFLIVDQPDTPDVYISRQSMTGIMTNDKVEVEIYKPRSFRGGKEDRLSGEITKVLGRSNTRVVGRFLPVDQKYGVLLDENRGWGADLRILTKDSMDAKEGEMVAVEITQYPDHKQEFTGRVVTIIGDVEDPVNDVIRIVHMSGIPTEFSKEAVEDARKFGGKVTDKEQHGREDLTDIPLITIDGATARDFDDAIYTEQTANGFRLIVAIADVSHYVKPGTRLDEEAYERGTSTYFPNYVVPMLPEELSNELCSLKPHVTRLCFCCEMNIDFQGAVQDYRFFEGVMESKARVTYGEAQELMEAHENGTAASNKSALKFKHVAANILRCADLAKILMQKRFREGSLDLEIPETQVVVDSTGESTDIIRSQRLFAHRLIEELMLVTNICTARVMEDFQIPGIYRVHEEPDPDAIKSLQRYLWNLGGSRSVMGGGLAKKLTQALESMKERPEAAILNILTLRTMQQAHYTNENVGHFGLGFTHYSHFTSPIRRYPDLIAHRIIKSQIYKQYHSMQMAEGEIASATTWLSSCEQRSVKAERKVISIKKARFIRRFVGQEFEGIISSVAKFGCFVLLKQYDVDGLVKVEDLGNDRFEFDQDNLRLIGHRTGIRYVIGDLLKVRVVAANPEDGKVNFELAEAPVRRRDDDVEGGDDFPKERLSGKKKKFDAQKRGKAKNDRSGVRKERVSKRRRKN